MDVLPAEPPDRSHLLQHGRLLKNAFFSLLGFLWPIALYLLATPYIVGRLGQEAYGLLALFVTLLNFLAILDLGLGVATLKYVAEYHARREFGRINEAVGTTLLFYLALGGLSGAAVYLGTPYLVHIFRVSVPLVEAATFAFHAVAVGFLINMVLGVVLSIPRALQHYKLASLAVMAMSTLNILAMVVIVALGYGLKQIVVSTLAINAGTALFLWFKSRQLVPGLRISLRFEPAVTTRLLKFGLFSFITSLSGVVTFHVDKMLIGALLGLGQVTLFTIPFDIAAKLHNIINSLSNAFFPLSSELSSTDRMERLTAVYISFSRLILMVSAGLAFPLLALSESFLRLWMGADFSQQALPTFQVLILAFLLLTASVVPYYLVNGMGNPHITAVFSLIDTTVNLTMSLILLRLVGPLGVPFAILITYCNALVFNYYVNRRFLKLKLSETFRRIFLLPLAGGTLLLLAFSPLNPYLPNLFLWLATYLLGLGGMGLFCFGVDPEVRQVAAGGLVWIRNRMGWPPRGEPIRAKQ